MIRYCHRCGCELSHTKDQKVVEFTTEYGQEFRVLCPTCCEMTIAFMTPAYIPEISKTEWELVVHKSKKTKGQSVFDQCRRQIKIMREKGCTVPEISAETGLTNRAVLELLK